MGQLTFHLIANAHLDPVWLWDWREGLNEGLITCRTVLDLMDEDPDLTFIRGEAAIYEHIERTDPALFRRIARYVRQGRWDVVGGTYIQPDMNLAATETFARQFVRGQQYFLSRFGKAVKVAWVADPFGHAAGLPEVLAKAGITGFTFTRPEYYRLELAKPAFWWRGPGGSRVMGYRPLMHWYGCERHEVRARLDWLLKCARQGDLDNVGVCYGMGNHGGGPTRRMIADIRAWSAEHPEVKIVHSGLHRLFEALYGEVAGKGDDFLPTHDGEMNYVFRGCYSSVAKLKFLYRHTEAMVSRAETADSAIAAALGRPAADLGEAWDAVLFNCFHDILPGSSIERAYDDQIAQLGGAVHDSHKTVLAAVNALAEQADTRVPPAPPDKPSMSAVLVFNPHPRPFEGLVEIETSLDYRMLWDYKGKADKVPVALLGPTGKGLGFQRIAAESRTSTEVPWRSRVVAPLTLPALGWAVMRYGYCEGAAKCPRPSKPARAPRPGVIDNGIYRVQARKGGAGVQIYHRGKALFAAKGLTAAVFEDKWGSWGDMGQKPADDHFAKPSEQWRVQAVETLESGPYRAMLWVRLAGANSRLDLTISLGAGREAVDVAARVLWNERSARLKLILPVGDEAEFDIPGGSVVRSKAGEVPGGRWVRVFGPAGQTLGFASDSLYSFELTRGLFRPTICRASRYATEKPMGPQQEPSHPAVDAGELKFRFLLSPGGDELPALAEDLEQPPIVQLVVKGDGKRGRAGSLAALAPASTKLLALKPAADGDGFILRAQNTAGRVAAVRLTWQGQRLTLGKVPAGQIATWRLSRRGKSWKAVETDITETA